MEVDTESFQVVVPGDRISEAEQLSREKRKVVLGPGLTTVTGDEIRATRAGILRKKNPCTFYVDSFQKRYVPVRGDFVIGIVSAKMGDLFRVDIGGSETACLPYQAFEGATKKNRPDVNVGNALYARLSVANRDLEPELVCVDSHGKKGRLGVLDDGFIFNTSINHIRKLMREDCPLMKALSKELHFEMAIGMNGKIWIKAKTVKETIAVGNAILASEHMDARQVKQMCDKIGRILAGFS